MMKKLCILGCLSGFLYLLGCATFQVAGQVQSGRSELLANNPQQALSYFQQAALSEPNYIFSYGPFREGVWTYLGRAQYGTGKLTDARQSFERALSVYRDDSMARLYLGLTLARGGDRSRGVKEIETGLKGIYDFLEYIRQYSLYGRYWDPGVEIRSAIKKDLDLIGGKDLDLQGLIARGEWVGLKMEQEIDLAKSDQRDYRERLDGRSGLSVGIFGP